MSLIFNMFYGIEDDNISFSTRFMLFENDGLSLMRFLSVNPFCEIIPIFIYVF